MSSLTCKWGHTFEKRLRNRACPMCAKDAHKRWYQNNLERARAQRRSSVGKWRASNLELSRARLREANKKYYRKNKPAAHARVIARRAGLKRACPTWVDKETLKLVYAARPVGMHVDHIVPLRGKNVCGLHVPWNLQYLPALENKQKHNRLLEAA